MTKTYLYPLEEKLCKIHLLGGLNGPIRQFKMSGSSTDRLPLVLLWTSGTSEVGTFLSLVNVPSLILILKAIILSGEQWFNACTVVGSEF